MNQKTQRYVELVRAWKLNQAIGNYQNYNNEMDTIWYSLNPEEEAWVEVELKKDWKPSAPQSLDMFDVSVEIGTSTFPRRKV